MKLKTFLDNLSKCKNKFKWKIVEGNVIRATFKNNHGYFCPIQAVYQARKEKTGYISHIEAAYELGIQIFDRQCIVRASDGHNDKLAKRIMRRVGLSNKGDRK